MAAMAEGEAPVAAAAEEAEEIAVQAAAAEVAVEEKAEEEVAVQAAVEEEVAVVAAAAEEIVPVEIWSLRLGQVYAAKLGAGATVKVCAVSLSHAAALLAVLAEKVEKAEWEVEGMGHLGAISYVGHLITLGIEALLPTVAENKRSEPYLRALWIWSWDLDGAAEGIPGKFYYRVRAHSVPQEPFHLD